MFKVLVIFLGLFLLFFYANEIFRAKTGKEKLETAKTILYSLSIATVVVAFLIIVVVLF